MFNNNDNIIHIVIKLQRKYYLNRVYFNIFIFSRIDSIINNISVYNFRYLISKLLGKHINHLNIDYIVSTPETSRIYCYGLSSVLNIPIQEAIILNRYVNRTFIIDNKNIIEKVKQEFAIIRELVEGKNMLHLDDSVEINTSGIVKC